MVGAKLTKIVQWVGFTQSEMIEYISKLGEPTFRADQIYHWVYSRKAESFHAMKNIPKPLRKTLTQLTEFHPLALIKISGANSSTTKKFLFKLSSGDMIESVLMNEGNRVTACLSTQVGCAMDCDFCATARM